MSWIVLENSSWPLINFHFNLLLCNENIFKDISDINLMHCHKSHVINRNISRYQQNWTSCQKLVLNRCLESSKFQAKIDHAAFLFIFEGHMLQFLFILFFFHFILFKTFIIKKGGYLVPKFRKTNTRLFVCLWVLKLLSQPTEVSKFNS